MDLALGISPELRLPERGTVRHLFDWLAPNYDSALVVYTLAQDLRWKRELLQRLEPQRGEMALDLASGTGLIYDRLVRLLGPRKVVGLDSNRRMLLWSLRGGGRRRLVNGDAVRLPFRDSTFDLVTAGYLFKYVPLDGLAGELRRVLKPRGRFGGYDFSAPVRGSIIGRAYEQYLLRLLPPLARWLGRGDRGWQALMDFLGSVATKSGWETRVDASFRHAGFGRVEQIASLGGAVTWVWAWK